MGSWVIEQSTFITNLAIYKTVGAEWGKVYNCFLSIQTAYTPLQMVTQDRRRRQNVFCASDVPAVFRGPSASATNRAQDNPPVAILSSVGC